MCDRTTTTVEGEGTLETQRAAAERHLSALCVCGSSPLLKFRQKLQCIVAVDPTELGGTETRRLYTSSRRGNVTERKIRPEDNLSSRNKELQRLQLNRIRRACSVIKEPPDVIQTRVGIRDFSQAVCRYLIA